MATIGTGSLPVADLRLQTGSRNYLKNSRSLEDYVIIPVNWFYYVTSAEENDDEVKTICGEALCNVEGV